MARNMVLTYLHLLDPEMTIDVRKRAVFNTFLWDLKVGCSLAALPKSAFLMGFSGSEDGILALSWWAVAENNTPGRVDDEFGDYNYPWYIGDYNNPIREFL